MPVIDTDDMDPEEVLAALQAAAMNFYPRDRDKFAAACPLSPDNLYGSYFRHIDEDTGDIEEGLVVGQPHATSQTSYYLVEFFGREGALGSQQIVDLERMLIQKWTFFDSEQWLAMSGEPNNAKPSNAKTVAKKEHRRE